MIQSIAIIIAGIFLVAGGIVGSLDIHAGLFLFKCAVVCVAVATGARLLLPPRRTAGDIIRRNGSGVRRG